MQPAMWTELFIQNKEPLVHELDTLIQRLEEYRNAISKEDEETLNQLIQQGSDQKTLVDKLAKNQQED